MDKKIKTKIGLTILIALICGLLGGLAMGYQGVFSKQLSFLAKTAEDEVVVEGEVSIEDSLTAEQVEEKILGYIREKIGLEVSLTATTTFQNGVYKLSLKVQGTDIVSYATKDGDVLFPEAIVLEEESTEPSENGGEEGAIPGNFSASGDEVCLEDGKPIIYFFGSEGCGYCKWEHPVIEAVASKFSDYISFHNNMDSNEDMDVFSKYSTGGVPTLVFGCKYYRVGAGVQSGEEQETKDLTALICKLTGNQPANVCEEI